METKEPSDPFEAALGLAGAFDRSGVPYALGGALALGMWAIPRATVDVDINVFVTADQLAVVFDAMESLGIDLDRERAVAEADTRGLFVAKYGRYRIDVFTPSIEFSWEAARTRVVENVEGQQVSFLSPEALAVFKMLFFRSKDLVDLQRLVAVQGAALDSDYVRQHLVSMMGEDDERVLRWDEMIAAYRTSGSASPQSGDR